MSANNALLSESINKCFTQFTDYFSLINEQWQKLSAFLNDPNNDELSEEIFKHEEEANKQYSKNNSRVEWYICQQSPVANNLRFFLAILMSFKDLEKCGDYVYTVVKIIKYENMDKKSEITTEIIQIWQILLEKIGTMWSIFVENSKKLSEDDFVKILKIKHEFNEEYKIFLRHINETTILKIDKTKYEQDISHIFIISIKIIRTIDHVFNVFKNFYLIDKPGVDISKTIELNIKSEI